MIKKKCCFLLLSIFLLTIAWPIYAEDMVDISGNYRIRGWNIQNPSFDSDADDDEASWDQRFRLKLDFTVSEGISATLQADFSEGDWGSDFNDWNGWASTKDGLAVKEVDYAYVTIDKKMFTLEAGQHWSGAGNYLIWDQNTTGFTLSLKTPVALMLNYSKMDERESLVDEDDTEDVDFYGINAGYTTDSFSVNLIYATRHDNSDQDLDHWGAGIQANASLGPVALNVEVNQFGGTFGPDKDVVGTQAFLEGSMAIKDKGTFGLRGFYAMGTDEDDEVQATGVNVGAWDFNPLGWGDTSSYAGEMLYYNYPAGNLDNWFYGGGPSIFDPAGANAGVLGISPYLIYNITDKVVLFANLGYLTPQEDSNTEFNNLTSFSISADWTVYKNVYVSAGYNYTGIDADDDSADDPRSTLATQLMVKF